MTLNALPGPQNQDRNRFIVEISFFGELLPLEVDSTAGRNQPSAI
jgi:hypothetical protein